MGEKRDGKVIRITFCVRRLKWIRSSGKVCEASELLSLAWVEMETCFTFSQFCNSYEWAVFSPQYKCWSFFSSFIATWGCQHRCIKWHSRFYKNSASFTSSMISLENHLFVCSLCKQKHFRVYSVFRFHSRWKLKKRKTLKVHSRKSLLEEKKENFSLLSELNGITKEEKIIIPSKG